jgi:hypothetical protein
MPTALPCTGEQVWAGVVAVSGVARAVRVLEGAGAGASLLQPICEFPSLSYPLPMLACMPSPCRLQGCL